MSQEFDEDPAFATQPFDQQTSSIRQAFQSAWQSGKPLSLEQCLRAVADQSRQVELLKELLAIEIEFRKRRGESPSAHDYRQRFPQAETIVAKLLQDLDDTIPIRHSTETPNNDTHVTRGGYTIIKQHARGGLGKVSIAQDTRLHRQVALKEIREDRWSDDAQRRFLNEAEITGQLEHPGIIPVYAMNDDSDGKPYYVMRFIAGQTMADVIRAYHAQPTAREFNRLLSSFVDLCQALGYAHSKQIIHRDLKPANIMLGSFGETLVLDWGLAKHLSQTDESGALADVTAGANATTYDGAVAGSHTQTGSVLGTPSFMAPEQARGEIARLDARCDVFGLGGILCAILTGKPPFVGQSLVQVSGLAQRGDLTEAFARLDASSGDKQLIAIAKHCLAAEPGDRPANASEVADAVVGFQAAVQEQLQQSELKRAAAEAKAIEERRRKRVALALAAAIVLLLAVSGAAWWNYRQEQVAAQFDALKLIDASSARIEEAERQQNNLLQMKESLAVAERDLARAAELIERKAIALPVSVDASRDLQQERIVAALADQKLLVELEKFEEDIASKTDVESLNLSFNVGMERIEVAFAEWGLKLGHGDPQAALAKISQRPQATQAVLTDYLQIHYALLHKLSPDSPSKAWLLLLLDRLDDDPYRRRLRQTLHTQDMEQFDQLVLELNVPAQPAMFLVGISQTLNRASDAQAKSFIEQACSAHPNSFLLQLMAGEIYLYKLQNRPQRLTKEERERGAEAIRHYYAATCVRPFSPGAHNNLAICYDIVGRNEEAIAMLRKVLELEPGMPMAYANLGNLYNEQGDLAGALAAYRQAIELNPKMAHPHLNLGKNLFEAGEQEEGLKEIQISLKLRPDFKEAHLALASALETLGREDEALAANLNAARVAPNDAFVHHNLGVLLSSLKRDDEALVAYRKAVEIDPKLAQSIMNIGHLLMNKGDVDGAMEHFQRSVQVMPGLYQGHLNMGTIFHLRGDYEQAIAAYNKAIALNPSEAIAHYNLGLSLYPAGRGREAREAFKKATELDPNSLEAFTLYGGQLSEDQQWADAIAAYETAIKLGSKDSRVHMNMGSALQALNRPSEALAAFQRAIEIAPQSPEPYYNQGVVYSALGKVDQAIEAYLQAIKIKPDIPTGHYRLANLYMRAGRYDEAELAFAAAIKVNPQHAEAHCNYGACLERQGKFKAALPFYETGHSLGSLQSNWRYPSAQWILNCRVLAKQDEQLKTVLVDGGEEVPPAEKLALARFASDRKHDYATATTLYKQAFAADAALADDPQSQHYYSAACVALLASTRNGMDALSEVATGYRDLAFEWLRADLKGWQSRITGGSPATLAAAKSALTSWQNRNALLTIQAEDELRILPEAEQERWKAFWSDVSKTLSSLPK